jgi:hypothetical protein
VNWKEAFHQGEAQVQLVNWKEASRRDDGLTECTTWGVVFPICDSLV